MQKIDTLTNTVDDILQSGLIRAGTSDTFSVEEVDWGIKFLRKNPLVFLKDVLGIKYVGPKMQQVVNHIADHPFTYVRSGHSTGKSFTLAATVIWYLETHENSMVFTTAPTGRQVTEILWKEIFKHRESAIVPLGGKFMRDRLKYSESWQGIGFASNKAVAYQGRHAEYMMWVLDEADGIEYEIWDAIKSSVSGSENRLVAIGNPVDIFSRFKKEQDLRPEDTFVISSYESPNIIEVNGEYVTDEIAPGCATMEWIRTWYQDFGEDSDEVRSRVLGEYPKTADPNALLSIGDIEGSFNIEGEEKEWLIIAVDVAYEGDDKSVLTFLSGSKFLGKAEYLKLDGKDLVEAVASWVAYWTQKEKTVTAIIYDSGGIATAFGEYLEDKYIESDIYLVAVNFGESPTPERVRSKDGLAHLMYNKRAEMYFDFRRAIKRGEVQIPRDFGLEQEVPRMLYATNSRGKFIVEPKDKIKAKLGHSPDISDSVVLAWHGWIRGFIFPKGEIDIAI